MDFDTVLLWLFILAVTVGAGLVTLKIFKPNNSGSNGKEDQQKEKKEGTAAATKAKSKTKSPPPKAKENSKGKVKLGKRKSTDSVSELFDVSNLHHWLAAVYKGHSAPVMSIDWSPNGKYLASSAFDRSVLIWIVDFSTKNHKNVKVNIPFDSARLTSWSPDSRAFLIAKLEDMVLEVYKLGKKPDGSLGNIVPAVQFQKEHNAIIVGASIACNGKFIMSCSRDGKLLIWNLRGIALDSLEPLHTKGIVCSAKISPCGRYVAACGDSASVVVQEILFDSESNYVGAKQFCRMDGHKSLVFDLAFNADSSRIVTVTCLGNWRLFDTTGHRVNLICQGVVDNYVESPNDEERTSVAMTLDGRVVAVAHRNEIFLFVPQIGTPNPIAKSWVIPNPQACAVAFSPDSQHLAASGDNIIRIYRNIAGLYAKAQDLESQLKDSNTSAAQKTRLQIELRETIAKIREQEVNED